MSVKIYSSGSLVSSGVIIENAYINYNKSMHVSSGGTANSTTVNSGGYMYISSGGVANDTTVNSNGWMHISSGGIANNTTVYNGGFLWLQGTASNTVLSGNAYGYASMTLASGGSAYDTDVNYRGSLKILSSAKIDETKVNSGGSMAVSFGGVANNTTINSDGLIDVYSGGTANNLTLKIGGQLGGFSFNEEKIWSSYIGAETEISDNVTINGNGMDVADKGVIDNVVVNSVATMYVSSGGTANNVKVNSRGIMRISSGGTVNNMIAQSGARIHMTVAPYTYVQGKYNNSAFEMKDGKLSGYTVDSAGYVGVTFGGTATETIVNSFGALHISSLAVANDNIVNANGSMVISLGGVAHNTVVNSRGYLYIYSGTHKGNLQIANGAIVSAYKGGVIDFTVADRTASDGYLINNLSLIKDTPTYTITVSDNQTDGIYKLAQGAGNFSSSISIGDGTINYGSITVNGEDFVYNDITYSLDQVDGNLTLTVENFIEDTTPPEKPQASANITTPTKRNVTVTAVFSNDSVVREYSLDGENWLEYERGVVFEQNGTVYFRGKDAAGNVSEIAVYNVENIELRDLTLSVYGNPAKWTNNDVSLTAISNRQAQIQYSFDGQEWFDGKSVVLTENKTVYFRAVDNFGNTAEKTVYVTKIDKVAPDTPLVSADVTENTNSAVTVTAVFSSDSVVKEYSLDGEN